MYKKIKLLSKTLESDFFIHIYKKKMITYLYSIDYVIYLLNKKSKILNTVIILI